MHDLVHDFAQFLTNNEFYMKNISDEPLFTDTRIPRHLTLTYTAEEVEPSYFRTSMFQAEKLRSLIVTGSPGCVKSSLRDSLSDFFQRLRCLRVLKLKEIDIVCLPSEIKELIHLRYLDLSGNRTLIELPNSVCSLYNLQTLNLHRCVKLPKLPRGMEKMSNLKHLDIRETTDLSLIEGIGNLTSLITLSKFIIDGASGGYNFRELKGLNLLQGGLQIKGLGRLKTEEEASVAELKKKALCCLELNFSYKKGIEEDVDAMTVETRMEGVLELLEPHPDLKVLIIKGYLGWKFSSWMASLTHLHELELFHCPNCTELPSSLGLLPFLEILSLDKLHNLKSIGAEIYCSSGGEIFFEGVVFPKLRGLNIIEASNLEVWEFADGEVEREIMPCVTTIYLPSNKLKALPALGKLPVLRTLKLSKSSEMTHIGPEFYGISNATVGGGSVKAFPNLKLLELSEMEKLEEFDLGVHVGGENRGEVIIMPRLVEMNFDILGNLKTLRCLSTLQSLEVVRLNRLDQLEYFQNHEGSIVTFPCLVYLLIVWCPKLKSLQHFHLPKLTKLIIASSKSLCHLPVATSLIYLEIRGTSIVPQGITGFKKLQHLSLERFSNSMSILKDARHLTTLQTLEMERCEWPPEPYCIDKQGEEWSNISHIRKITIDKLVHLQADQSLRTTQVVNITSPGSLVSRDDDVPVSDEVDYSSMTEIKPGSMLLTEVDNTSNASMILKLTIGFLILLSLLVCLSVVGGRWKI